ncbi:MAG: hypothetical protein K2R98_32100 [Gemmataceae bacterium]|nr:hypothetical protein [Gemmataceae bacterium]
MSAVEFPAPPLGAAAGLEFTADSLVVTLHGRGVSPFRKDVRLGLGLMLAGGPGLVLIAAAALYQTGIRLTDSLTGEPLALIALQACFIATAALAAGIGVLVNVARNALDSATIRVHSGRLTVRCAGLFQSCGWEWESDTIRHVRAEKGLRIGTDRNTITIALRRPVGEICWIAVVLRQALQIAARSPRRGEVAVVYCGSCTIESPLAGFLHVAPGEMYLHDAFGEDTSIYFLASRGPWTARRVRHILGFGGVSLSPGDILCRRSDDESSMHIAPSSGLFSYVITCTDSDALPRALEQFWGAQA